MGFDVRRWSQCSAGKSKKASGASRSLVRQATALSYLASYLSANTSIAASAGVSLLSGGSGRLDTRLDTPPLTNRRHPDSRFEGTMGAESYGRHRLYLCFVGICM